MTSPFTIISSLAGIPVGIKDLFSVRGVHTEACSNILKGYKSPFDATVISKLRNDGALFIGKTNMDEFACGGSNEYSSYGAVHNPWDLSKVAGGSSGGSAASVASGQVSYALGTDTGGSVRQPASLCGISGLKPSYGRNSRFGVIAMASSFDTVGVFARSAKDISYVMETIAGHDKYDATTPKVEVPKYSKMLDVPLSDMTFGVPKEYFGEGVELGVIDAVEQAIEDIKKTGAKIKEVSMPHTKYALAVYYVIVPAEISANMARYDGIRFGDGLGDSSDEAKDLIDYYFKVRDKGFGAEMKRRIMIGTYTLSSGYIDAYFKKALKVRTLIKRDFEEVFEEVDALLTPVSPFVAWDIGSKNDNPLAMYMSDLLTVPASVAGVPAMSVPCGFSENLPVGLQIIGPSFREDLVLNIGHQYQQITDWHTKKPKNQ